MGGAGATRAGGLDRPLFLSRDLCLLAQRPTGLGCLCVLLRTGSPRELPDLGLWLPSSDSPKSSLLGTKERGPNVFCGLGVLLKGLDGRALSKEFADLARWEVRAAFAAFAAALLAEALRGANFGGG